MSQFVIRAGDAEAGPLLLAEHLPMRATTLRCLPGPDGEGEFWCARLARPVKYRVDEGFDRQRCQAEFLGTDAHGEFLWVTVVVVWTCRPLERFHPGMQALEVQVAYVVDQTLGRDSVFDSGKVDVIGAAVVDDVGESATSACSTGTAGSLEKVSEADKSAADGPGTPLVRDVRDFDDELNRMVATLAALTGLHPGPGFPRRAAGPTGETPTSAVYVIEPDVVRYFRFDPVAGWGWSAPKDLDDLLYQVVNDTARELAWRWSEKAPAARAAESRRQTIAMDMWRILMAALDWVT